MGRARLLICLACRITWRRHWHYHCLPRLGRDAYDQSRSRNYALDEYADHAYSRPGSKRDSPGCTGDRRDLTLAPNPEIALALQIMKEDPDKAEMLVGESFRRQLAQLAGQQQQ